MYMEIEMVACECCGLKEECTPDYISSVKSEFDGKWLCGLCSEAVRDEASKRPGLVEDAMRAHMSFCGKMKSNNPAVKVADGMRLMLRRRSSSHVPSKFSKRYTRSNSVSHVGDVSPYSMY